MINIPFICSDSYANYLSKPSLLERVGAVLLKTDLNKRRPTLFRISMKEFLFLNWSFLLLAQFLFFSGTVHAQENTELQIPGMEVIPPSPNAQAMNKFVDVPVGKYTGIADISVPIFELKLAQFSLPIVLKYHSSGLKVAEEASWVGAGWSLDAGGAIMRVVRGLPDEWTGAGTPAAGSCEATEGQGQPERGFFRIGEEFFIVSDIFAPKYF